jgi:tryptophanyl-tRNA synthetase
MKQEMPMKRILSGIQPSGKLHIGNYFGMMQPMIRHMEAADLYVFIVDLHALTSVQDRDRLRQGTLEAAADFIALGLDPDRCTFWVQSDVPEVCELTWMLSILTPMGLLERCHSYKDKVAKNIPASHGLFSYPVLMAADILLYQAEVVPVGKDQKQHLEVARDIAIRFNNMYGTTFVVPEPEISDTSAIIPGLDGQKMSKSYDNTIPIFLDEKALRKRVMAIQTDATPVDAPKDPDKCSLYALLKLFAPPEKMQEVHGLYINGGAAYGYLKQDLFAYINNYFADARARKKELLDDPGYLRQVLAAGAEKARAKASVTLELARDRMGLKY